jgi:Glycosyl transferases group 1/Glycosyltransferase Family 4
MRILHLDTGREMRGGQWQVYRLVDGLRRQGVECTLMARPESPLFAMARRAGLPVEPLGLRGAIRLGQAYDLVHAHDARSHTLGILTGKPLVVSRRVAFPVRSHWKYGRARRYLAVSGFVKAVLLAGGVPEEKISVVYDGVPLLEPARGTAVLALANAGDPQKGAPLALEAARLAGLTLRLTASLERDLPDAGLFVYITHSEGLGSAALLAMSAGVPVVASDVGGLREVVRHRENGLLVENSAAAIAAALRELTENPELARRFGHAARQTVQERFTVDIMLGRTMEVYRQVLS